jgi:5'-3' exonuclease
LLLLDTASLYYRAYYGVPDSVTAPDGRPANAIRGLLEFMARLIADRQPSSVVACWDDDWRPEFRVAAIPSYKAHRVVEASDEDGDTGDEDVPDTLAPQVEAIADVLDAYGIARIGHPGFEADDVIATLTVRHDGPVDIVTGDRDLFQLVDDQRLVRVLYTAKGVKAADVIDEAAITAKYGIPGRAYAAFAALRGDPSDGLPGAKGIGEKTAAAIVQRFTTIPEILAALDADDPELPAKPKLLASRDYLTIAPSVVDVVTSVPLKERDLSLPHEAQDTTALESLSAEWGLASPLRRLAEAIERAATP